MITKASEVAKHILVHFQAKGAPINNLKLQKLLYYCQAWHLGIYDKPLFHDRIEAWIHGPVVPFVYRAYKAFQWSPITVDSGSTLPGECGDHVESVLKAYGSFSAWELERLTHSENPWKQARGGIPPDQSSHAIITHESMKAAFNI